LFDDEKASAGAFSLKNFLNNQKELIKKLASSSLEEGMGITSMEYVYI